MFAKEFKLFLCFNPFCNHLQAKIVPHDDNRVGDRRIVGIGRHIADKRPVDLDRIDRQSLQIGQRRITRPEIVNCDLQAKLAQFIKDGCRSFDFMHHHGFSDFKNDA